MKMKNLAIICFLLILYSCKQGNRSATDIISIDPRIFPEVEISLAEFADDISYIPLDNQFPIGIIYSYKIINDFIYAAIKDVGVVRFTNTGKLDKKFGKIGRGPGEYVYCLSFAVDENTGTVYVMDHKSNDIEVYTNDGKYVRNIKLFVDDEGFGLSDIEFFNSSLVLAQYINMGRGAFDWIILDTQGNRIQEKKNPYPSFNGRVGGGGGLFKFNGRIGYWDSFKDTLFSISSNFDYSPMCILSAGEHRFPRNSDAYNSASDFLKAMDKYLNSYLFIETKQFLIYKFSYMKQNSCAFIQKNTLKVFVNHFQFNRGVFTGGATNNIDAGLDFIPDNYFAINRNEYLVETIQPFQLKAHIATNEFKNSTPKFPEKKKALEKLANSLDENDNPVLMLVKLKE
jgi:hypothetical protein